MNQGQRLEQQRAARRANAAHFLRFRGDGYDLVTSPERTTVTRQRSAWELESSKLHDQIKDDMAPVLVESKSRPGVSFQSIMFLQRRHTA
jgi:hypothetical protein